MKWHTLLILAAAAFIGLSCGGENAPPAPDRTSNAPLDGNPQASGTSSSAAPAARSAPALNIPEGARWTVFCQSFSGPNHMGQAKAMKDYLLQGTHLKDWYIVQGEQSTTLYYGYYREIDEKADKAEGSRAQSDRAAISSLIDPRTGERMFRTVLLTPLDAADPSAPPEWDLRNARGYWSLQIASFRDDPQRKERAVEVVRELRKEGKEAFYYHGPTISSVCIGAFPKEAASKQGTGDVEQPAQRAANVDASMVPPDWIPAHVTQDWLTNQQPEPRRQSPMAPIRTRDPNATLMVIPSGVANLPQNMTTPDGRRVETYMPKLEIYDPRLAELIRQFPTNAENGVEGTQVMVQGKMVNKYFPSFLVIIPHDGSAQAANASQPPTADSTLTPPPDTLRPQAPIVPRPPIATGRTQPQGGKLKSLDE